MLINNNPSYSSSSYDLTICSMFFLYRLLLVVVNQERGDKLRIYLQL